MVCLDLAYGKTLRELIMGCQPHFENMPSIFYMYCINGLHKWSPYIFYDTIYPIGYRTNYNLFKFISFKIYSKVLEVNEV